MVVGEQFVEPTHGVIDIWMNCHRLGRRLVGTVGHLFVGIVQTGLNNVLIHRLDKPELVLGQQQTSVNSAQIGLNNVLIRRLDKLELLAERHFH